MNKWLDKKLQKTEAKLHSDIFHRIEVLKGKIHQLELKSKPDSSKVESIKAEINELSEFNKNDFKYQIEIRDATIRKFRSLLIQSSRFFHGYNIDMVNLLKQIDKELQNEKIRNY